MTTNIYDILSIIDDVYIYDHSIQDELFNKCFESGIQYSCSDSCCAVYSVLMNMDETQQ